MKTRIALITIAVCLAPVASQARWLNPNTGRFQTMDTYEGDRGEPQTLHKYTYCQNNPVMGTDPSGHDVMDVGAMVATMNIQSVLAQFSVPAAIKAEAAAGGALTVPMTREQAIARYGAYKGGIVKAGNWPNESRWMVTYTIPERITSDPDYGWVNAAAGGGIKTRRIYLNKDIQPRLEQALDKLQTAKNLKQLKTFDGCFNARAVRGVSAISAHAYGIALDINASDNTMGTQGNQPQSLIDAFTGSGFIWGGTFGSGRQDPMHFSLGF